MTVTIPGQKMQTSHPTRLHTAAFVLGVILAVLGGTLLSTLAQAETSGFATNSTAAANPLANAQQNSNPLAGAPTSRDDFLPVDQAYQLDVLFDTDNVSAVFQIAPEYYLYRDKLALYLRQGGEKTELPLTLASGETIWDDYFEKETEVYRWQLEVPIALPDIPSSATGAEPLQLEVHYQGCADAGLCYPPQTRYFELDPQQQTAVAIDAPSTGSSGGSTAGTDFKPLAATPSATGGGLLLAVALAFAGGILLNLMPCVFPVLSIKALAITHNGDHRRHLHGWMYTAGVVATFVGIAALMLGLRAAGEAVGWGFQLQSPAVVAVLIYLFFAMGLSLSGVTEFGTRLMGLGAGNTAGTGLGGSFATGALATVVASPCTAPFMGSALGFAITQSPLIALAVFAALGAGMAAPFLLLTYVPRLAERLPRPGPWMETLKQLLAFPMYLTAVWLLWVLGRQTGSDGVALVLAGAVAIAFALWMWPRPQDDGRKWRWGKGTVAIATAAIALLLLPQLSTRTDSLNQGQKSGYWQTYSPDALDAARAEGQPVLINMTAAWCITCLANEKAVLSSDTVTAAVESLGITALKGDWTNQDPQISELLTRYGRTSVPLYLLYPAGGGEPQILPQILTRDGLLKAMREAVRSGTLEASGDQN
ncbi:protein-disulfide reductase DsbD [Microbulbifer sp.]|uniref:protein-disulfide reductase DsbD family protein n=1 Tax=Microbulbifer sp. TaxID=1908541 RepID=UPI00258442C0|nr:protein-disulfide reductase DsbD [Microbulbifer sp.]